MNGAAAEKTAFVTPPKPSKRPPGRPPKSGARALSRYIRENTLDRRTWVAKRYEENADKIAADGGGWNALTNREKALVWLASGLLLELQVRQSYRLKQLERGTLKIDDDDHWFGWLYNSFTRVMQLLGVRPDRVERLPSLTEYIAARAAAPAGNGAEAVEDAASAPIAAADGQNIEPDAGEPDAAPAGNGGAG